MELMYDRWPGVQEPTVAVSCIHSCSRAAQMVLACPCVNATLTLLACHPAAALPCCFSRVLWPRNRPSCCFRNEPYVVQRASGARLTGKAWQRLTPVLPWWVAVGSTWPPSNHVP